MADGAPGHSDGARLAIDAASGRQTATTSLGPPAKQGAQLSIDLTPVRQILQADGGDIELVGEDDGVAHLRLIVDGAQCAECVLPRPMLEDVAAKLLNVPVRIEDPRE